MILDSDRMSDCQNMLKQLRSRERSWTATSLRGRNIDEKKHIDTDPVV